MAEETLQSPTVFDTEKASIGDVYAKALLGAGQTSGKTSQLLEGLQGVVEAVNSLPNLKEMLESPRVAVDAKQGLLDKAFGGKLDKDLLNFLKIVGNKGRFDCLSQICDSATRLFDEQSGNVTAEVITANEVDSTVASDIAAQLEKALGKKVTVKTTVDPNLIGGMVVRIGDTIHDASVVSQLNQVRTRAVKRASDAIRSSLDKFLQN